MAYLDRLVGRFLEAALAVQPAVVVQGARQAGKSTLVRHHPALAGFTYLTLDNAEVRDQAITRPASLIGIAERLIIDEIQRVPELLLSVKESIDRDRRPGRYVLTGSANILSRRIAGESLAGRASYVTLWPLTHRERWGLGRAGRWSDIVTAPVGYWMELLQGSNETPDDWRMAARRSGYPVPVTAVMDAPEQAIWLDGYADTYVDRDIRDLAQIARPLDMRRLMRAVCASIGQVENQAGWGQLTGMKRSTVSRYLDLLETTYQLVRVPAYSVNRTKRLAKSPKVYWSDTAFALRLIGSADPSGFHFENMILTDLAAWSASEAERPQVHHWRTVGGDEVDFVVELPDGRPLAIEVKAAARPQWSDVAGLRLFLEEYPAAIGGLVLHGGEESYRISDRIVAVPWWRVV